MFRMNRDDTPGQNQISLIANFQLNLLQTPNTHTHTHTIVNSPDCFVRPWHDTLLLKIAYVVSSCSFSQTATSTSSILQATTRKCPLCTYQAYGYTSVFSSLSFFFFEYTFDSITIGLVFMKSKLFPFFFYFQIRLMLVRIVLSGWHLGVI